MKSDIFFIDSFTKNVCDDLSNTIHKLFKVTLSSSEVAQHFTSPPHPDWGHWAFPCFFLSRLVKKKPNIIADQIACSYRQPSYLFKKVVNQGGYANFFFQPSFLTQALLLPIIQGELFKVPIKSCGLQLIEYSQPNTHKELHIGHLRNLCFGLALTRLLKKRGWLVTTCTFPGDIGTHVAKCLWYLKYHNQESPPQKETHPPFIRRGQWLGKIYTQACLKFDEDLKNTEKAQQNKQHITKILQDLKNKQGEFYSLWNQTKQWSYELILAVYEWIGADFDKWYWESEVDQPSVEWVQQLYKKHKLEMSESAIGLDLKELGFCLLLKSDGNGLYATKDLYLAQQKMKDFNPKENIYVVDQRQETHFQQVLAVLKHIGCDKTASCFQHLKYNFVELPSGPMSSRAGNILPVMELIQDMTIYAKKNFLQKYQNTWANHEIQQTAELVTQGAIKYGMNEQDLNKKIIFNRKEWLNWNGRSGPYIQYAYARSCSLLEKFGVLNQSIACPPALLDTREEQQLLLHLSWFNLITEKAAIYKKTSPLCNYLFELAKKFSQFYQNCPIGNLKDQQKRNFRLSLSQATRMTLREGLSYLSIPAPKKM